MNEIPITVWLWFGGLLVQSVAFSVIGTWWVSRVISAIRAEIASERKEVDSALLEAESYLREQVAATQRMAGESVSALREYVHSIEKFMRDTYVRRDSFFQTTDAVKQQIKEFSDRLEQRIGVMDKKIDRLQSRGDGGER